MTDNAGWGFGPIHSEIVIPKEPDDGTMRCPSCGGLGSNLANGGMDSMSISTDKDGNTVIKSTRYPCPSCHGKGRVKKCTACRGRGHHPLDK